MLLNCLPKQLYYFVFPSVIIESSCCSLSSPGFDVVSALRFDHSNRGTVASHCFNFHQDTWCGTSFPMLVLSFLRFLFSSFCLFLNWIVCFLTEFLSSLHTLDESFIRYDFLWILSLSCHLILLTVSFVDHMFLIFRKSSFLSLLWITPLVLYLKSSLCPRSSRFCPVLSSSFIVLHLHWRLWSIFNFCDCIWSFSLIS